MCGRYTLASAPAELREEFGIDAVPGSLGPRYNIAPRQEAPVIALSRSGERRLRPLVWGLVPSWAGDPAIGARAINARAETIADRPAFREAFRERRCLVPADGFYEWQRSARGRQPWHFHRGDGRPFAFAGLWERWRGPDGAVLDTFTIVTRPASEEVAPIHDRMPVILDARGRAEWLDPATPVERLHALLRPCSHPELRSAPVSALVNSPANDGPECLMPAPVVVPTTGTEA